MAARRQRGGPEGKGGRTSQFRFQTCPPSLLLSHHQCCAAIKRDDATRFAWGGGTRARQKAARLAQREHLD